MVAWNIANFAAINAVIAFVYYGKVVKTTFFDPVREGLDIEALERADVPAPIGFAVGLTAVGVVVLGIFPGLAANIGEFSAEILAVFGL